MQIAICDDSIVLANQVETGLLKYDAKRFEIDVYTNPLRLIESLPNNDYAFFILDIEMPVMSGVDLARRIREFGNDNPIIFLTSYKEYMEDVFALHTFDYLLKPIDQAKLDQTLTRLIKYLGLDERRFTFTFNRELHSLDLNQIIYFEKNRHRVLIHTKDKVYETMLTTNDLLDKLDDRFVQVHQSFIVNVKYVQHLKNQTVILDNAVVISISRKYQEQARKQIVTALKEMMT
ncbi:MAG: LytTR family DNA-binding domain-containing protein [Lactobacillaceae bacterium]|jgi:DNA-binding LytR/AlgR family response regulator|nr:LytTR family DNA-binding domain-containing protein [Lactobacillaceae bacterium]